MTLRERIEAIAAPLPDGAAVTLPVDVLRAWLADETPAPQPAAATDSDSWRARLWTCPADMRLGVREVAEAMDRSADWVYRATSATQAKQKGRTPLPCAKLDGGLLFTAGAVRDWLKRSEVVVVPIRRAG